jgi:hypothetical protein
MVFEKEFYYLMDMKAMSMAYDLINQWMTVGISASASESIWQRFGTPDSGKWALGTCLLKWELPWLVQKVKSMCSCSQIININD